jgi:hypothetical protein
MAPHRLHLEARPYSERVEPVEITPVELRRLEPLTPCLQSDVYARSNCADLARQLSVSSREIPLRIPVNGTLMARDLDWPGLDPVWSVAVCAAPGPVSLPGRPGGDAEGDDGVDRPATRPDGEHDQCEQHPAAWAAHLRFWVSSPAVAPEPSRSPRRCSTWPTGSCPSHSPGPSPRPSGAFVKAKGNPPQRDGGVESTHAGHPAAAPDKRHATLAATKLVSHGTGLAHDLLST